MKYTCQTCNKNFKSTEALTMHQTAKHQAAHQAAPSKAVKLKIEGMHCASCEVLIERKLKKLPGVEKVAVTQGEAQVTTTQSFNLKAANAAVKPHGYTIHLADSYNPVQTNSLIDYVQIGAIFLIMVAGYLVLKRFGLAPQIGVTENMSYGLIFVLGLVAATSTCLAVTGGLLVAISAKYAEAHPNLTRKQRFKPHIYFNIGRVISYTILGALLGLIGSFFVFSPQASGIVTILASLLMIILGLQMLHLIPGLDKVKVKMPKFIAHRIYEKGTQEYKPTAPFLLGASTFFFPCGFTQALQLYVLTMGNPLVGALTMLAFSLGTLPGLLSVGAISSFAKGKVQKYFVRFAAVLVILLGVFSISAGLNLAGINPATISFGSGDTPAPIVNGVQVVQMKVEGLEYFPSKFTVVEGVPVRWEIDGRNAAGCAKVITIPKLGKTEYLTDGIKVIEFTPTETGTISFSCTMGMTTPGAAFKVVKQAA
jgi:uncharacterized protein